MILQDEADKISILLTFQGLIFMSALVTVLRLFKHRVFEAYVFSLIRMFNCGKFYIYKCGDFSIEKTVINIYLKWKTIVFQYNYCCFALYFCLMANIGSSPSPYDHVYYVDTTCINNYSWTFCFYSIYLQLYLKCIYSLLELLVLYSDSTVAWNIVW